MSVYILGELNVDMIVGGEDVIPEWNREKVVDRFQVVLGSSSAITACALAGLGQDVQFVSVVGDDEFGHFCVNRLKEKGVDTTHVQMSRDVQTGVTLSFSTSKDRGLVTYMGSIAALTPADIPEELYSRAEHVHFGSYFLQDGMRDHWPQLFERIRNHGISTSFDTGWDVRNNWQRDGIVELLAHTDLFIPSEEEILHILGASSVDEVVTALPSQRLWVLIKRGAQGSMLISPEGKVMTAPAYDIQPVDTTGAGDSFNAGAIAGWLSGKHGKDWIEFANACGAASTLRIGGAEQVSTLVDIHHFQETHRLKKD
ncbi:carbohydrate kinase family protein [Paenibacillus sp. J2TS4]|uniref:carbohydrate kinase family protein n=1 Tax=Paenibacillus sp. J2TS4 TaxID=2807194 RepID=UPI001B110E4E|nr:sugar kinase [Paenibacillus sp. J2TS4]GIP33596.1 ribokinase [Paenibacillus sp. J2TS4]